MARISQLPDFIVTNIFYILPKSKQYILYVRLCWKCREHVAIMIIIIIFAAISLCYMDKRIWVPIYVETNFSLSSSNSFYLSYSTFRKYLCILQFQILMVCIWRHGGHVRRTTQRNMLLISLSNPAGVGGWHCPPHPQRLIANQELSCPCFPNNYSWFAINHSECGGQCQPPTPAGSDNGINNIFFCFVPPTWLAWRQMQTIN